MSRQQIKSQIGSVLTYQMYYRQFKTLAQVVFNFKNLPQFIDKSFMNKTLVNQGAIAFFYDDILDSVLALPFRNVSTLDIYGRPLKIEVYSLNGYTRILDKDEFVIMYDNEGRYPLYLDILQYSERYSYYTKVRDLNIIQQKTPRIYKTSEDNRKSIEAIINDIDGLCDKVFTYKDIDLDDLDAVVAPAPFIADKIEQERQNLYNEFLRLIGIANLSYTKKERNIRDEIFSMQGGTIASRYNRFGTRKDALDIINEKFRNYLEKPIEVEYYDGLPTTMELPENDNSYEDEGVEV